MVFTSFMWSTVAPKIIIQISLVLPDLITVQLGLNASFEKLKMVFFKTNSWNCTFKANWYKAEQYCRFHGMHLASINSADDQKNLQDHVQAYGISLCCFELRSYFILKLISRHGPRTLLDLRNWPGWRG